MNRGNRAGVELDTSSRLSTPEVINSDKSDLTKSEHPSLSRKFGTTLLVGSLLAGSGLAYHSYQIRQAKEQSMAESTRQLLIQVEAQAKIDAQSQARRIANSLNENLQGGAAAIKTKIINGTILKRVVTSSNKVEYVPIVMDAIVLSPILSSEVDKTGNFLAGSWIGIIGKSPSNDPIDIQLMKYNPATMKLDTKYQLLLEVLLIARHVNQVGFGQAHQVLAYDSDFNQIYVDSGQLLEVGVDVSSVA